MSANEVIDPPALVFNVTWKITEYAEEPDFYGEIARGNQKVQRWKKNPPDAAWVGIPLCRDMIRGYEARRCLGFDGFSDPGLYYVPQETLEDALANAPKYGSIGAEIGHLNEWYRCMVEDFKRLVAWYNNDWWHEEAKVELLVDGSVLDAEYIGNIESDGGDDYKKEAVDECIGTLLGNLEQSLTDQIRQQEEEINRQQAVLNYLKLAGDPPYTIKETRQ